MKRIYGYLLAAACVLGCGEESSGTSGGTNPEDKPIEGTGACSASGTCANKDELCCYGQCVNVKTSSAHCGRCETSCGNEFCVDGACESSCKGENRLICSGACIDRQTDMSNCGRCGNVCGRNMVCEDGECVCKSGFYNCNGDNRDGCEIIGRCTCDPGVTEECYPYDMATKGVGVCHGGTMTCTSEAEWSQCVGAVGPSKEIEGNQLDDDCDGVVDEHEDNSAVIETPECSSKEYKPTAGKALSDADAVKLAQAMDICTTVDKDGYGLISAQLLHADGSKLEAAGNKTVCGTKNTVISPAEQAAVLTSLGGIEKPVKYSTMAVLASGKAIGSENTNVSDCMGSEVSAPAEFLKAHGGYLPNACGKDTKGTQANDSIMLRLKLKAPDKALSFKFRFKFYSKEYPKYVCNDYNDFFLALTDAKSKKVPEDRNVSFDSKHNPVSVNNAFFTVCSKSACTASQGCSDCTSGSDGVKAYINNVNEAGATDWLSTSVPVSPNEEFTLDLVIFDAGEKPGSTAPNTSGFGHLRDSLVLLDNFEWIAEDTDVITIVN